MFIQNSNKKQKMHIIFRALVFCTIKNFKVIVSSNNNENITKSNLLFCNKLLSFSHDVPSKTGSY